MQAPVVIFTNDARGDLTGFDRDSLVNDPRLFGVVAHFHMPGSWKIFSERVTNETIVRQNSAQVRMSIKNDTKQIKSFTLEPVGRIPDIVHRSDHGHGVIRNKHLQTHALIQTHRQKMTDNAVTQTIT